MKNFLKEWKWVIIVGLVLLAFGLFIRVNQLTSLPVFADEAIYIRWAQIMSREPTLRFLPLSDGKQPLYMWILMFYVHRMEDPLFAGRILSVLSGMGTTIGIFAVSYLLFKNKLVSIMSSMIWIISPFSFFFDRMALVDSLLAMLTTWTLFFGILTSKTKRLDFAMITGFGLGGALLTKSPAIFVTLLLPTTWIMSSFPKNKKAIITHVLKLGILLLVTYLIGYGMYNILRLGPNFGQVGSRNQDYVLPISHLWTNPKDPFIFHIEQIFKDWFVKMGPWPVLGLIVIGLIGGWKKYWREKLLLLAWFLGPVLVESEYAKVFTVRYILSTLPPIFIIAAGGFVEKTKIVRLLSVLLVGVFVIFSFIFDYQISYNRPVANLPSSERSGYLEEWTAGDGIKETSVLIKAEHDKNPNEKIVVGTEGYFGTLPDGLQMYLQAIPNVTVIGTGLDFGEVPRSLLDSLSSGNKTYFVVNSSRLKIKPENFEENGLRVVASFRKADRREKNTHEFIRHGPYDTLYFFEVVKPVEK